MRRKTGSNQRLVLRILMENGGKDNRTTFVHKYLKEKGVSDDKMEKSSMYRALRTLDDRGLITREKRKGRIISISLTEEGKEAAKDYFEVKP